MPLEASSVIGSVAGLAEIAKEALRDTGDAATPVSGTRSRSGSVPSSGSD